jgi:hypothetical protein
MTFSTSDSAAGTIIKLSLGNDTAADVMYNGTTLSTTNDGNGSTPGDQNTSIDFTDFLSDQPDILTPLASVSFGGLTPAGVATVFANTLVLQNFAGGTIELYDPSNVLLLSGDLGNSTLAGPLGPPATGALFTTSFSTVTGGSLANRIAPGSLTFSMNLTSINSGAGLSVTGDLLNPFLADASLNIDGEVPEPASGLLTLLGCMFATVAWRYGRE